MSGTKTTYEQRIMQDPAVPDPRNDEDYDTYDYGTEPLPGDRTWQRLPLLERNVSEAGKTGHSRP